MIIIGERINSTRTKIQEAVKSRNASLILREADTQLKSGANYVDVNCAVTSGDEVQDIDWVISVIQSEIPDVSICIDSPNYLAIARALEIYKAKGSVIINSITGEESRIKKILPLALKHNARLIALTMDGRGMPDTAQERYDIARNIYEHVKKAGFKTEHLYFDALIRPISTEPQQAKEFLKSIPMIKALGDVKTVCGLSNVSFGLPERSLINSSFLSMAVHSGIDAVILDPLNRGVMAGLKAACALIGADEYCSDYIKAFREGQLVC